MKFKYKPSPLQKCFNYPQQLSKRLILTTHESGAIRIKLNKIRYDSSQFYLWIIKVNSSIRYNYSTSHNFPNCGMYAWRLTNSFQEIIDLFETEIPTEVFIRILFNLDNVI